jgi:fucose permease
MHIWLYRSDRLCVCSSHHRLSLAQLFLPYFLFSGAQVGVASLAVNFMDSQGIGIDASKASQLFSFCQITFTFGRYIRAVHRGAITIRNYFFCRFIGVLILNFVDPALLLSFYGIACCVFSVCVALATGKAGVGCLFALFFFESICYPVCSLTILPTKNLMHQCLVCFHSGYEKSRCSHQARLRSNRYGEETLSSTLTRFVTCH